MSRAIREAKKERAKENFLADTDVLLQEVRKVMSYYRLDDWDCYIVMRKSGNEESFVVAIEPDASEDGTFFGRALADVHRAAARSRQ